MKGYEHRIRAGMVGGGPGAGIATAHRAGMRLDGRYDLVAGSFSRDFEKSRDTARELGVDRTRVYASYTEMADAEAAREDGIEVVAIVTPNASHYPISKVFLERGIHVVCDKPLTDSLDKGVELLHLAKSQCLILALTHNYSCYAMVREAASRVRNGELGTLRMVQGEFASGWAAGNVESEVGNKQAAWRVDPAQASRVSVVLDLGTHIHHLARFVSGLEVEALAADLSTAVPGRRVYDNANVMLRFANDVRGAFWITMAATGAEHGLRLRVVGSKASLEWRHECPYHLVMKYPGGRCETLAQGGVALTDPVGALTRIGLGHPEGFLESFANMYSEVADAIVAARKKDPSDMHFVFPTARDGVLGLQFVELVAASADRGSRWVEVPAIDL